jgi:sulfate adenylyltransferase
MVGDDRFVEVFVDTPIEVCEQRDVKGLYAEARAGKRTGFTGIDDPYEPPLAPEVMVPTGSEPVGESLSRILGYLESRGLITPAREAAAGGTR